MHATHRLCRWVHRYPQITAEGRSELVRARVAHAPFAGLPASDCHSMHSTYDPHGVQS